MAAPADEPFSYTMDREVSFRVESDGKHAELRVPARIYKRFDDKAREFCQTLSLPQTLHLTSKLLDRLCMTEDGNSQGHKDWVEEREGHWISPSINQELKDVTDKWAQSAASNDEPTELSKGPWTFPSAFQDARIGFYAENSGHYIPSLRSAGTDKNGRQRKRTLLTTEHTCKIRPLHDSPQVERDPRTGQTFLSFENGVMMCNGSQFSLSRDQRTRFEEELAKRILQDAHEVLVQVQRKDKISRQLYDVLDDEKEKLPRTLTCESLSSNPGLDSRRIRLAIPKDPSMEATPLEVGRRLKKTNWLRDLPISEGTHKEEYANTKRIIQSFEDFITERADMTDLRPSSVSHQQWAELFGELRKAVTKEASVVLAKELYKHKEDPTAFEVTGTLDLKLYDCKAIQRCRYREEEEDPAWGDSEIEVIDPDEATHLCPVWTFRDSNNNTLASSRKPMSNMYRMPHLTSAYVSLGEPGQFRLNS